MTNWNGEGQMFKKNRADKKIEIRVSEKDKSKIKELAKDKSITEFIKSLILEYSKNSNSNNVDVNKNYFTTRELTCLMQLINFKRDRQGDLLSFDDKKEFEIIEKKIMKLGKQIIGLDDDQ
jgi:hypothetical protein